MFLINKILIFSGLFLLFFVPITVSAQFENNIEFVIKNGNGDRIETQNITLLIFDERNELIATLNGSETLNSYLEQNHKYQIDVYMTDFLVTTEYFYFDNQSSATITVPNSHGIIFSVFYKDGKPLQNAKVTLLTNKNTKISNLVTDSEGNTLRAWISPTLRTEDSYQVLVEDGTLSYIENNISLLPGEQSRYSVTVPWPSIAESLIEIELVGNDDKKIDGKNFDFSLINKKNERKYSPSSIIKGNIFVSQIPLGDYSIIMIEKNSKTNFESESFQINGSKKISVTLPTYSISNLVYDEEIKKSGITCNCVAFRLDDIQNHWLNNVQISVMEVFRETQNPLTVGVIAKGIGEDPVIKNYIDSRLGKNPELEIANHSWDNTRYTDLTKDQQDEMLKKSQNKIKEIFSITPKVFIPPQNAYNDDTIYNLKKNGYTHYSSEFDFSTPPFPLKGQEIYHFPAGAETGHLDKELKLFIGVDSNTTFQDIKGSIASYGFAVVTMHPQEFSIIQNGIYTNEINPEQINQLKQLIENIRSEGLRVVPLGKINLGPIIDKDDLPGWLKTTAHWWGKGQISDQEFIDGIHFLIKSDIITVSESENSYPEGDIPPWIRSNARWWANNQISNEEFVRGIQFLVDSNIIHLT